MAALPSAISIRDIAVQKEANDLVIATFGRGIWVMDDYSVLQTIKESDLTKNTIFKPEEALVYIESKPYGHKGKSFQGESFFTAKNPPVGAVIHFYLNEEFKSLKDLRKEKEKERVKNNLPVYYPSADSIRMEDQELPPQLFLVITDESGDEVRKLKVNYKKGMQQVIWNGRHELSAPVNFNVPDTENPYYEEDKGPAAVPGNYAAQLIKMSSGKTEAVSNKQSFKLVTLNNAVISPVNEARQQQLNKEISEFRRVVLGSNDYLSHLKNRINYLKAGAIQTSNGLSLMNDIIQFENLSKVLDLALHGNSSLAKREFETVPGFIGEMETMVYYTWSQTHGSTATLENKFKELKTLFAAHYQKIKEIKSLVEQIEQKAEAKKMPATYGRLPEWK